MTQNDDHCEAVDLAGENMNVASNTIEFDIAEVESIDVELSEHQARILVEMLPELIAKERRAHAHGQSYGHVRITRLENTRERLQAALEEIDDD